MLMYGPEASYYPEQDEQVRAWFDLPTFISG